MCLITNQLEPKIAEEDIPVYKKLLSSKLGLNYVTSVYQNHLYTLKELNITKIWSTKNEYEMVFFDSTDDAAVHNYLRKICDYKFIYWRPFVLDNILLCIAEGFHSALSPDRLGNLAGLTYKCTIPKGSEYYLSFTDLIVSNQIIIVEEYVEQKSES